MPLHASVAFSRALCSRLPYELPTAWEVRKSSDSESLWALVGIPNAGMLDMCIACAFEGPFDDEHVTHCMVWNTTSPPRHMYSSRGRPLASQCPDSGQLMIPNTVCE
eukprot:7299917-Lingulodinium_polyedra.AAC.1